MKKFSYALFLIQFILFGLCLIFYVFFGIAALTTYGVLGKLLFVIIFTLSLCTLYSPWCSAKGFSSCGKPKFYASVVGSFLGAIFGGAFFVGFITNDNILQSTIPLVIFIGHLLIIKAQFKCINTYNKALNSDC